MRADRLVAILLLLQQRGQVTAAEVAGELEISERTARRDLEALGVAGLPVYSVQGRHGGWRLAGGGRTDLSGLTAGEARALLLVTGTSTAATPEVKAALRKLVRALPEPLRARAEAASRAVVVDPRGWGGRGAPQRPAPPHLADVQAAVVEGHQLRLRYVARDGAETERVVHPLGLAAKAGTWYLLAGTDAGLRTFRVDRVAALAPTGDPVVRPDGFDLEAAWQLVSDAVEERRTPARARALVRPDRLERLAWAFGDRLRTGGPAADGRVEVELRGWAPEALAWEVAGFGAAVEVLDPPELRRRLAELGAELVAAYA